ncbi:hypothetical protein A3A95_03310 [Candidatus Nomurabacteria bacterium RIFCSPLOWO2_01_FULL_39_18]|uniref:Mutator family transposase n=1 Tax=Candidatus Nomurabacteria bacterium RIFCSPHIGHO2_01_FULL_40_24b TaxID=1801739 RepID=A0A1F6V6H8_9BACT|nr:MAG: hypothetical protein A2647_05145 [Candidatus Nomurabacteria bacterium RIFCSPHIGHO2_01_FULL_40_24b]OGI89115.1 MAG: hypothetical protein A3A95_03310 [Candidatus Nomurabacteria bacterium RIFCSPLOWO2_01_FULL_39_18]
MQTYSCNDCGRRFRNERREKTSFEKKIWNEYVFEKQTLRELKEKHHQDKRTLKNVLNQYHARKKTHEPRAVNLVVDALYFGERKEDRSWCTVCFRDPKRKENLWWGFAKSETTGIYLQGRAYLENLGYTILSVAGDGFGGLRIAFSNIPLQMCHVHMERLVVHGTTRKPILEAGIALFALIKTLHYTEGNTFKNYFKKYVSKYQSFLNEKTINPITGKSDFTHEPLHKAVLSLMRFLPYLFTFEKDENIARTTNTLEGHFFHIRDIIGVHRGLSRAHTEKVLNSIFLASTIAPSEEKLDDIL